MKPPKCKSCGAEEWRHVCQPKTVSPARASKTGVVAGSNPATEIVAKHRPSMGVPAAVSTGEVQPAKAASEAGLDRGVAQSGGAPPPFDRNAYQREYMRSYRAKKAGKK